MDWENKIAMRKEKPSSFRIWCACTRYLTAVCYHSTNAHNNASDKQTHCYMLEITFIHGINNQCIGNTRYIAGNKSYVWVCVCVSLYVCARVCAYINKRIQSLRLGICISLTILHGTFHNSHWGYCNILDNHKMTKTTIKIDTKRGK